MCNAQTNWITHFTLLIYVEEIPNMRNYIWLWQKTVELKISTRLDFEWIEIANHDDTVIYCCLLCHYCIICLNVTSFEAYVNVRTRQILRTALWWLSSTSPQQSPPPQNCNQIRRFSITHFFEHFSVCRSNRPPSDKGDEKCAFFGRQKQIQNVLLSKWPIPMREA